MLLRPSEDDLIARYFAPIAGPGGLSLKDDAALVAVPDGAELVVTVDALVAGVHFFADDPPETIAVKALGVNLSDLAAKGADPLGFVLALALPRDWMPDWLKAFANGLGQAAETYGCPLLGGDTTRTLGPMMLSITALGTVPKGKMVRRTHAQPGDVIAVSGTIGDAALGLKIRKTPALDWVAALGERDFGFLLERYLKPRPRVVLAPVLREYVRAGMDVSDGLVGDLAKMLRASGVTGILRVDDVPLSAAAHAAIGYEPALMADAVTGGDDYEVLITLQPEKVADLKAAAKKAGVPFSVIGEVKAGTEPLTVTYKGESFETASGSYSHF